MYVYMGSGGRKYLDYSIEVCVLLYRQTGKKKLLFIISSHAHVWNALTARFTWDIRQNMT